MKRKNKGITLVALVITVIILIILAGVTLNTLLGNNGIITKAKEAKQNMTNASDEEIKVLNKMSNDIDIILEDNEDNENNPIIDKIKIGDYITYDAGIWKKEELEELKGNNFYTNGELPGTDAGFKFGGFIENQSRNKAIDAYGGSNITSNHTFSEGWRVLDINEDGSLKIVSAGTVEAFRHLGSSPIEGFEAGYYSEYILRKVVNKNDTEHTEQDYINAGIIPRDFTMYENELAKPNTAHCMSLYDAYNITGSLDETQNNLRDLGIYYHLASGQNKIALARVQPGGTILMSGNTCYGIRIVLDLKPEVKISKDNNGDGTSFEKAWKLELEMY